MPKEYDVRFSTDETFLREVAGDLGMEFNRNAVLDIMQEALTLYGHVAKEATQGRLVVNCDPDGKNVEKIHLHHCEYARRQALRKK